MFVHQATLDALKLKKDKSTDYVFSWKSKRVFNSKIKPLYTTFLYSIKLSEYRIGIKDPSAVKDPLVADKTITCAKL